MTAKLPFTCLVFICFCFLLLSPTLVFAQKKVIESYLNRQKQLADSVQQVKAKKIELANQKAAEIAQKQQADEDTIKKLRAELQKQAQNKVVGTTKIAENKPNVDTLPTAPIDTILFQNRLLQIKRPFAAEVGEGLQKRSEKQWSLQQGMSSKNVYKVKHKLKEPNQNFVFGWHPYWVGEAYQSYNFSLLSALAYFSYELNPKTGGYFSVHDWETTALVDSAQKHEVSVLLTVTNLGYRNNEVFLKNKAAQRNLAYQLIDLLKKRNANGINLDFENIAKSNKDLFTNFVIDLSNQLKKADSSYVITLAVPALDFDEIFDFVQLNNYVSYYVVMGYEFYGKGSTKAGPIAPLSSGKLWWSYDLEQSLKNHLAAAMPAEKMVFALPYYGAEWQTEDLKLASNVMPPEKGFRSYHTYRYIKNNYKHLIFNEEASSGSRFYLDQDKNRNCKQIWFEDEVSLAKKYDWILKNKLKGVGIWALGYDNGYTELWELIAHKFALPDTVAKTDTTKTENIANLEVAPPSFFDKLVGRLLQSPTTLLNILTNPALLRGDLFAVLLLALPLLGLTINTSVFYLLLRLGFTLKQASKWVIRGLILVLILCLLLYLFYLLFWDSTNDFRYQFAQNSWLLLTLGLLLAFIVGFMVAFWVIKRMLLKKELP